MEARLQLARVQRPQPPVGHRQFHPVRKANPFAHHRGQNQRHPVRQQALRRHRLNEVSSDQAVPAEGLSLERQLALRANLAGHRFSHSVRRRHHLNTVSHKTGSPRPLNLDRPVVRRTHQIKVAARLSEATVAGHLRQPAPVRVSVAAAQSEDSRPATVSPARHLLVQDLAKGEAGKSEVNRESINLQPRRLQRRVRAKREAEEKEDRGLMVNPAGNQEAERLRRLSAARANNKNVERRKARGHHPRGHSNACQFS